MPKQNRLETERGKGREATAQAGENELAASGRNQKPALASSYFKKDTDQ
jgi:hypothetical protein